MPEGSRKFHEFALKSSLFKGRSDWYFCYLKTEKLAHALTIAVDNFQEVDGLGDRVSEIPGAIAYLAAGETPITSVLADIFSVLSNLRMQVARGLINKEAGALICREYEEVAQRLVLGSHPSPFISAQDFHIGSLPELETPVAIQQRLPVQAVKDIKDTHRENKGQTDKMSERMSLILTFIRKNKQVSIKEIASVIRNCSEKTIQRELGSLIEQGLVRKVGERRWSVYMPA